MIPYWGAPAVAATGVPRVLVAEMTGDPARDPKAEGVGTVEIPKRKAIEM